MLTVSRSTRLFWAFALVLGASPVQADAIYDGGRGVIVLTDNEYQSWRRGGQVMVKIGQEVDRSDPLFRA